ncbi:hypothetical protein ACFFNY_19545 [Paenibacillus hodogayensis]|uniref:Uncharacterized protein n=1 Tax=Paenibacillus hodogayensis TaxID=279208 RepID=A0ABV5VZM8_9BACL
MLFPTEESLAWVIPLALANLALCTYLEVRMRRNIRRGRIDKRRYSARQLEEFERMRVRLDDKNSRRT